MNTILYSTPPKELGTVYWMPVETSSLLTFLVGETKRLRNAALGSGLC